MKTTHLPSHPMSPSLFRPPRRRWPGVLAVGVIGAVLAFVVFDAFFARHLAEPAELATPAAIHGTVTTEIPTPATGAPPVEHNEQNQLKAAEAPKADDTQK
ncbi:MAG: hypothetical protein WAQ05_01665 [Rubrivivax sp.]